MKVLHIFNEINFSGAEIMYAGAAPLFKAAGIEMIAISTGKKPGNYVAHFLEAGIKVIHKPFISRTINPVYLWKYWRTIRGVIRENDIDTIHIHRGDVFWYFSVCGYLTRKKTVMTLHNVFKTKKYSWIIHYLTRYTARTIFKLTFQSIGESVYENELHYFRNPTTRINNWYDSNKFYPASDPGEKQTVRRRLGIPDEAFVIIVVGRCTEIKNHVDILRAVAQLKEFPQVVLLHLGSGHLEKYEQQQSNALDIKALFLGNQTGVRDYLIASDVYVMTSRFEGLAISAIEAMACRLPAILYNNPGMRDLIKDNDNGFLVAPEPDRVKDSLVLFLKHPDMQAEKGANALQYAQSNHLMHDSVNKILELYKS